MAAYRRVYDSCHLQADCQEPGSAPEPYTLGSRVWATFTFLRCYTAKPSAIPLTGEPKDRWQRRRAGGKYGRKTKATHTRTGWWPPLAGLVHVINCFAVRMYFCCRHTAPRWRIEGGGEVNVSDTGIQQFMPLTFILVIIIIIIIISFPSPTHSFIPGLKPSFSANHSHCSLSFSSSGLTT